MESVQVPITLFCTPTAQQIAICTIIQCYTTRGCLEYDLRLKTMETCYEKPNANINLLMKLHKLIFSSLIL